MMLRNVFMLIGALALVGCNTNPPTSVQLPTTVRPNPTPVAAADGSIYRANGSRPLFEDRRARFVGDIITVNLVEKTSANRKTNESMARTSNANVNVGRQTVLGQKMNIGTNIAGSSDISSSNAQDDGNSNTVSGTIAVTVTEVLPNGNLMVSGEKMVAINQGTEFVRLSGVINPIDISGANTVSSTRIADAKMESKNKQSVDTAQVMSALARFFTTVLMPF